MTEWLESLEHDEFDECESFEVVDELVHREAEGDGELERVDSKEGVHALHEVSRVIRVGTDLHAFSVGRLWCVW